MAKFSFLKILLLEFIEEKGKATGYDFIKYCKDNGIKASPGTVYPHLSDLYKRNLVEIETDGRRKKYRLTKKGKEIIEKIRASKKEFKELMNKLGILFDKKNFEMPENLRKNFRILFLSLIENKWNKRGIEKILKVIKIIEKELIKELRSYE